MSSSQRATIRPLQGRPCLYVAGQPLAYGSYWARNFPGDTLQERLQRQVEAMAHFPPRGIHQYETASLANGWGPDGFDRTYGKRGFPLDEWLAAVVAMDPEALVLPSLIFQPPDWWKEQHPDELEQSAYGDRFGASLGSELFRREMAEACARAIEFVESTPYRDHVFGYDVWWVGSEGFTEGCLFNVPVDFSPAMRRAFQGYLREKYEDSADALQEAWRDSSVSFDNVTVPTLDERRSPDGLNLLDPTLCRRVLDYYDCAGEGLFRHFEAMFNAAKEACDGRALVGTYGGYVQVAGWSPNYWGADGPAGAYERRDPFQGMPDPEIDTHRSAGQFTWTRILDLPSCDFLASPYDYLYRRWGAPLLNQSLGESAQLRGKLAWINEDTRTYLHGSTQYSGADTPEETWALQRRNFAAIHTTCNGCNWMEQASPWLLDEPILQELEQYNRFLQAGIHWPDYPDPSGALCVVIDEESLKYQAPFTDLDFEHIYKPRVYGLSHCGVPLKIHAFRDLERDNFPAYRGYLFLNLWYVNDEKQALLREKVLRDGNVVVWQYAPGYVRASGCSVESMRELTGIGLRRVSIRWEHMITLHNWRHPLTAPLPADCTYGSERRYGPAFVVDDPEATSLGWLMLAQGRHEHGLAVKEIGRGARGNGGGERGRGDWASVFSEAPLMPAGLVREIARYAGCHVYSEENDVLYAGRSLLAVHAAKPGPRALRLPEPVTVWDLYEQRIVSRDQSQFLADFPEPGTKVFFLGDEPGV